MTTLGQIVSQVRHRLAGAGEVIETVTALTAPIDATDTTLSVDSPRGSPQGVIEVGFEQVRIKDADPTAGTFTAWPFGRGYNGTTATAHDADSEVTISPRWAASTVAAEVNGVLTEIYPTLYAVKTHEASYASWVDGTAFTLPDDAAGIIAVHRPSGTGTWAREDAWRWEPNAGQYLFLGHANAGDAVRVTYAARPGLFDTNWDPAESFEDATGLDARVADLLILGVAARLATFIDLARTAQRGAEAKADQREQALGVALARTLQAQFEARVAAERDILNRENPVRVHKNGR